MWFLGMLLSSGICSLAGWGAMSALGARGIGIVGQGWGIGMSAKVAGAVAGGLFGAGIYHNVIYPQLKPSYDELYRLQERRERLKQELEHLEVVEAMILEAMEVRKLKRLRG